MSDFEKSRADGLEVQRDYLAKELGYFIEYTIEAYHNGLQDKVLGRITKETLETYKVRYDKALRAKRKLWDLKDQTGKDFTIELKEPENEQKPSVDD